MAIPAALLVRAAALGIKVLGRNAKTIIREVSKKEKKIRDLSSKTRSGQSGTRIKLIKGQRRMTTKKGGKGGVPSGLGITRKKP